MIIIKYPFGEFIKNKDHNLYDEMARPPVKFKNPKTGEFEGDNHVSSRMPIFTDKYDIYYLYQFPPEFWPAAMTARYNRFLYDAVKQGEDYNDIQDITLTSPGGGKGGTPVIFKQRNTFASHLVDKLKRDVDVDHFRKHGKGKENQEKYEKEAEGHKAAGRDLGGYIGASLDSPVKHGESWAAKGFVPPGMVHDNLKAWRDGSSEGWLEDLEGVEHVEGKAKKLGGRGAAGGYDIKAFAGADLKRLQQEMHKAGAVPFRILANNKVAWRDVEKRIKGKMIDFPLFTASSKDSPDLQGQHLPILFPGKSIHSNDIDSHEADKRVLQKLNNMGDSEYEMMQFNLDPKIRELQDEIDRNDLNDTWGDVDSLGKSKKRLEAVTQLQFMQSLDSFRNKLKEQNPGRPIDPQLVKNALPAFTQDMQSTMRERLKNARKYNAHDYNVHMYNRERKGHDPLEVGMANPTTVGPLKHEQLRDNKTAGMGTIWANRQSKHMLHGAEGEWENKYQGSFGHGYDDIAKEFKNKSQLSQDDHKDIEKQTNVYLGKIAQKMSKDPAVMEFLGVNPTDAQHLTDFDFLRSRIKQQVPDIDFGRDGKIKSDDDRVPELLRKAFNEIRDTNKELSKISNEVESGFSESAIARGVKNFINSPGASARPDVKAAMESRVDMIVMSAENFVRRTIGESAFRNYEEALRKGVKGSEKRTYLEDLKEFISSKAYVYAGTVAQLKMGSIGSRRLREKGSRIASIDVDSAKMHSGSMAGSISDDYRVDRDVLDKLLDANSGKLARNVDPDMFQGDAERNQYRRYRQASDEYSGPGHNVDSVYSLLEKAGLKKVTQQKANDAIEQLKDGAGQVNSQETEMVSGISFSVSLFNLKKQMAQRDAERKGQKISEKDANKIARDAVISWAKTNKYIPMDYEEPSGPVSPDEYGKDLRQRIDDDSSLDSQENEVAQIVSRWQDAGWDRHKINLELNKMTMFKNVSEKDKKVVDMLLMYYGRKPEMGTFDDQPAMAASLLSTLLPDIDAKISDSRRKKAAQMAMKGIPGRVQPQQQAPVQQPVAPPVAPQAPRPTSPGTSPLANRIRKI